MMNRQPVSSSNVESVGYDREAKTLEVEFKNGNVYQYFDVPETIYDGMIQAESVGGYLAAQIKGEYRYARV